jgi:hypothetical protein
VEINLDGLEIDVLLDTEDGMVGEYLREKADEVAMLARAEAPVRTGFAWNNSATPTSNASPPGYLKASIHGKVGRSARTGHIYGSANVAADPALFITYPAIQIHSPNLFMSTALYSVTSI